MSFTLVLVLDHSIDRFQQGMQKGVVVLVGQQEAGR